MRGEDLAHMTYPSIGLGSPPHARGRRSWPGVVSGSTGITPACAGKTVRCSDGLLGYGDHPRMRGEDVFRRFTMLFQEGSPPHARGRRSSRYSSARRVRITPACAGKTRFRGGGRCRGTDHPRMRGEDTSPSGQNGRRIGSPPHARGRLSRSARSAAGSWITPACAGKTPRQRREGYASPDHPRMRGEDVAIRAGEGIDPGSPPHARGRHKPLQRPRNSLLDHPRMRGEDRVLLPEKGYRSGITPACAGKTERACSGVACQGITPACAGKTRLGTARASTATDHPRMRGEDIDMMIISELEVGSPPHARGRRRIQLIPKQVRRITPACAGKTKTCHCFAHLHKDHPRMRGEDWT